MTHYLFEDEQAIIVIGRHQKNLLFFCSKSDDKNKREISCPYLGAVLFSTDKVLFWGHRVLITCNLEVNLLMIGHDI
jgi:hypothetical protein